MLRATLAAATALALSSAATATLTGIVAEASDAVINGTPVRVTRVFVTVSSTADRILDVTAYPVAGGATFHHRDVFTDGEYSTTVGSFSPAMSFAGGALDSFVTVGNTVNSTNQTQPGEGWGVNGLNRPDFPVVAGSNMTCSWLSFNPNAAAPNTLGRILIGQFVTNHDDFALLTLQVRALNTGTLISGNVLLSPDLCPNSAKTAPGECGCDETDTDSDLDLASDCHDAPTIETALPSPLAAAKVNPGNFGSAVRVSGDWLAVGASTSMYLGELERGAVIVYRRGAKGWTQFQTIVAPLEFPFSPNALDTFGASLEFGGGTLFVGAPSRRFAATGTAARGTVYAYRFDESAQKWTLRQSIESPRQNLAGGSNLGIRICFDAIASRLFVSDLGDRADPAHVGSVSILELDGDGLWTERAHVVNPANDTSNQMYFGMGVAARGDELVVGAPGTMWTPDGYTAGTAYAYRRNAQGAWDLVQTIPHPTGSNPGGDFGWSIGLNGRTLAITAGRIFVPAPWGLPFPPKEYPGVELYERSKSGQWQPVARLVPSDLVATLTGTADSSPRVTLDGDRLAFTLGQGRRSYVFRRIGGSEWIQHSKERYGAAVNQLGAGSATLAGPLLVSAFGPQRPQDDGTLVAQDLGLADCDGDGAADKDTDGDGLPDCIDPDANGDGVDE